MFVRLFVCWFVYLCVCVLVRLCALKDGSLLTRLNAILEQCLLEAFQDSSYRDRPIEDEWLLHSVVEMQINEKRI